MRPGPHQIGTTGAADGDVLAYDAATDEYGPQAPGASGVESVSEGPRINVDNTDPANPVVALATELYVLTSVLGTDPVPVWDGDNQLVYTEVPIP